MTLEEIEPLLINSRRTSRGVIACCPAHNDRTPSLSVREGKDAILLRCWAGCSLKEICNTLGILVKDLFYHQGQQTYRKRQQIKRVDWRITASELLNASDNAQSKHKKIQEILNELDTNEWGDTEFERAWGCLDKAKAQQQRATRLESLAYTIRERGLRGDYENFR